MVQTTQTRKCIMIIRIYCLLPGSVPLHLGQHLSRCGGLLYLYFDVLLTDQLPVHNFEIMWIESKVTRWISSLGEFTKTVHFVSDLCFENSLVLKSQCGNKLYRVVCIQLGMSLWDGLPSNLLKSWRLTTAFILHYLAWLLVPRELCSQIDVLSLWGWYRSIKLY